MSEEGEKATNGPAAGPGPNFVRPKPGRTKPKGEEKQPRPQQPPTKAEQPQPKPQPSPTTQTDQQQPQTTPNPKKRGRKPGSFTRNKKHLAARLKKEHDAREAYRLRYIEGKTLKEIAEKLNRKSQGQLHTLIEEEKRRLRGAFTEDALSHWNFAYYELVSLFASARDNYAITEDAKQGRLAAFILDKIVKMTVGYLPSETRLTGTVNLNHEHAGTVAIADIATLRTQMLHDPAYLEFLRTNALDADVVDVASKPASTEPIAVPIAPEGQPAPLNGDAGTLR